jgi:ATP-binding cassette subfamily D (ALD) long-chain fatty acid import protein
MSVLSKPLPTPSRKQLLILLASILLLRSSFVSGPKYVLSKLKVAARGNRLTPQELLEALQQVFVKEEDGSKTLLVPYRDDYVSKVRFGRSTIPRQRPL